jgi:hypothetical protein
VGRDFSPGLSDRTPELKFRLHTDLFRLHAEISANRLAQVAACQLEDFTRRS